MRQIYFCLMLCLFTRSIHAQTLNTDPGIYTPYPSAGLLQTQSIRGGLNNDIEVGVHSSKQYSGIVAGLTINGVNVIDSRSIGGSAWQTSYLLSSPTSSDIYVFNQAAGNSAGFVWGYDNYSPSPIYNSIYSDHRHPGGDFGVSEAHCPCGGFTSVALDRGRPQISLSTRNVDLQNVANTKVIQINKRYSMQSLIGNQSWDKYALEQAFYLSRRVANQHRLKAYIKFRDNRRIYSVDLSRINIQYPVLPQNFVYGFSALTSVERRFESNQQVEINSQYYNPSADYVVFVWDIAGQEIGVAIDLPSSNGFGGAHLNIEKNVFCLDINDFSCGNINWHSWIYDLERDSSKTRLDISGTQTRTFSLNYYIGTVEQLNTLGYVSKSVSPSPEIHNNKSIVPILDLLLLD